ncbi:MAG: cyclic nucleotide-binding domain-containing protein [Gammaproteobacteria bacterium]|nr:cyclic nucleotide-binding domain-containing protein [Gammaproteobacteria bacterium]
MSTKISFLELNNYQPLDTLTPENLKEIANELDIVELANGDIVFEEGDKDDHHIFLYKGSVDLIKAGKILKTLEAGTADTKSALAHIIPRNFSCSASSDAIIFNVDADQLDTMLAWNQTGSFQVEELSDNDDDWMTRLLQTEVFRRIPPANIQAIFTSLEDIDVNIGDSIVKQDDAGDYFYIIKSGRCMVTRKNPGQDKDIKLADLSTGDTFGEEALISDATRNASVVMLSKGTLSLLSKENFLKLLNEPIVEKIDYTAANLKVNYGQAIWLDVRLPAEYQSAHIKDATHMPLISLRLKMQELDPMVNYILYCDTERRSASASYILSEKGFKTSILSNGIKDVPNECLDGTNV